MIEFIHRHPIFIKVLLAVVTITFVLTGGWLLRREDVSEYAAKVNDEKITLKEYEDALYKMQEFYRSAYKGSIPEDVMKKLDLNKRALGSLINRKIVLLAAKKEGIQASDEEVSEAVTSNRSFQGEDGRFNRSRYIEVLKLNGTAPAEYERALRDEITMEKFGRMVKDSVYVTEADVREYYTKQIEAQKKPFKEEDYQKQKPEIIRIVTLLEQEKAMNSFMEDLKSGYKVEVNPRLLSAG